MGEKTLLLGKSPEEWLAEYRRVELAVAARLPAEGGRFSVGEDWIELLPVWDEGEGLGVVVLEGSDPGITLFDVHRELYEPLFSETGQQDTLRQEVEVLRREVAELRRLLVRDRVEVSSPYLKAEEAAEYLRISIKALYGLVERRKVNPLPGHRKYRFTREGLDAFLRGE